MRVAKGVFLAFVAFLSISVGQTHAISRSEIVELSIPATTVTMQGWAAPNSLVQITDNTNSLISSISADSTGYFTTTVNRSSGVNTFGLQFTDLNGVKSAKSTVSVSVQAQQNTIVERVLAPTFVRGSALEIEQGSILQFRGYGPASSKIYLYIDGIKTSYDMITDSNGYYEFLIPSSDINAGKHTAYVIAEKDTQKSESSTAQEFTIVVTPGMLPQPDIVVRPDQLPPPLFQSPENGAVIDAKNVLISGESIPLAQINIYADGELYGTISADRYGKWSFVFTPTYSPVTFTFEACINGRCSVLSQTLTLNFTSIDKRCSEIVFELGQYRYWGLRPNETVTLDVLRTSGSGVIEIDWGDGISETFDHNHERPTEITKQYASSGTYSGRMDFIQDNCRISRYFSVQKSVETESNKSRSFWLFSIALVLAAPLSYMINRYGERYKPKQSSKKR